MKALHLLWVLLISVGVVSVVAAGYTFRYSLATIGIYSLSLYGVFTISHFLLQMLFAHLNKRGWPQVPGYRPTVSVVIPTYREDSLLLRQCLESVDLQGYPLEQVILSNDGDDVYIREVYDEVARGRPNWIYLENGHSGKRTAMHRGFAVCTGELIVCMDSDTVLRPGALEALTAPLAYPEVGCVTGNVRVLNASQNLLTMVTDKRYWLAFNLERAAQSYFGVMSCVSGPLGAYRRSLIEQVKDRWLYQRFLGTPCTFGDDRHLTNLALQAGFKSVFVPGAHAETEAPGQVLRWGQQQLRWSRSFFREFVVNAQWFHRHHPWLAYDLTYQASFPFFLVANVAIILYLTMTDTSAFLGLWLGLLVFFGLLRASFGVVSTGSPGFLLFTGYGLLYFTILLPLKVYALVTVWKTTWGTQPHHHKAS